MAGAAALCLLCAAFSSWAGLAAAKGTFQPLGYNLYSWGSGPSHPPGVGFRPHNKHKNWCAFVATKSVTCVIQNGSDAHVKAEYQPCAWGISKCSRTLTYRVYQRPAYRVGYKSVTELEWRCCPGFHGVNCQDGTGGLPPGAGIGPGDRGGAGDRGGPGGDADGRPGGATAEVPRGTIDGAHGGTHGGAGGAGGGQVPSQRIDGAGSRGSELLGERVSRLEDENRRLASSLEKMQVSLAGMGDSLRAAAQEDASRLLLTLLGSGGTVRLPEGAAVHDGSLPDLRAAGLRLGPNGQLVAPGLQEVASKVTHVTDVLKTKSEALEELQGLVLDHTHKIQQLMDISKNGGDATATEHDLSAIDAYLQKRIDAAKTQILSGLEQRAAALQCSCDTQLVVLQQQQEQQRDRRVQETLDGFSSRLDDLQTRLGPATEPDGDCCAELSSRLADLASQVSLVGDAHRTLNARLDSEVARLAGGGAGGGALPEDIEAALQERFDDLEARVNASERNAEVHCQYVQDVLRGQFAADIDGVQTGLDSKLQGFEDKFVNIFTEIGGGGQGGGGGGDAAGETARLLGAELGDLRALIAGFVANSSVAAGHLDGLEGRLQDLEEVCSTKCVVSEPELEGIKTDIADCRDKQELLLLRLERQSHTLRVVNRTVHELQARGPDGGGGGGGGAGDEVGTLQGELTILKVNFNAFNRSLKGLRDSVAREQHHHDDDERERARETTTVVETERQLVQEVAQMQRLLSDHGSRISLGDRRAWGLRAELGRLAGQLVAEIGRCKVTATAAHKEAHGFDGRVSHVEDACSRLHGFSQSLDRVREATERAALEARSQLERLERASASRERDVSELKGALDTVERRLGEVAAASGAAPPLSEALPGPTRSAAAFSASLSRRGAGDAVKFDRVLLNDGASYEPHTGVFRAPYPGRYLVSVALPGSSGSPVSRASLLLSGQPVGWVSSGGAVPGPSLGGEQKQEKEVVEEEVVEEEGVSSLLAVLALREGDTLQVAASLGDIRPGATFSAAMLYETQDGNV